MIYHENLGSKSHIGNQLVINVTGGKNLILYRNYRQGSEANSGKLDQKMTTQTDI